MKSHKEMQEMTAMKNPLIALQISPGNGSDWRTDRIFIDDDEADAFVDQQRYRYPKETERMAWRFYAIPAAGQLAVVVKQARDGAHDLMALEVKRLRVEIELLEQEASFHSPQTP